MEESAQGINLTSILASVITFLGVIGIIAQVVSYSFARDFYTQFGLEPESVGVTPINAAFRLTNTAIILTGLLVAVSILLVFVIAAGYAGLVALSQRKADIMESIAQAEREIAKLESNDPHGVVNRTSMERLKGEISSRRLTLDKFDIARRVPLLRDQGMRRITVIIVLILPILVASYSFFLKGAIASQDLADELRRHGGRTVGSQVPDFLFNDLSPNPVMVRWFEDDRVPADLALDGHTGRAYEFGAANGKVILWFRDQNIVVTVNDTDVTIARDGP